MRRKEAVMDKDRRRVLEERLRFAVRLLHEEGMKARPFFRSVKRQCRESGMSEGEMAEIKDSEQQRIRAGIVL